MLGGVSKGAILKPPYTIVVEEIRRQLFKLLWYHPEYIIYSSCHGLFHYPYSTLHNAILPQCYPNVQAFRAAVPGAQNF